MHRVQVLWHCKARLLHSKLSHLLERVPRRGVIGHHRALFPRRGHRAAIDTVRLKAQSRDIVRREKLGKVLVHRIAVRLCPQRHLRFAQSPSKDDPVLNTVGHTP